MPHSVASPQEVYARVFMPLRRGLPLFVPQPSTSLPVDYIKRGAEGGDVGLIGTDGSFFFVFSVCAAADDPINRDHFGVPEGFQQFYPRAQNFSRHPSMWKKGSEFKSHSIKKTRTDVGGGIEENVILNSPLGVNVHYKLESSFSEGAVLHMPDGASSTDYEGDRDYEYYAMQYGESWSRFIKENVRSSIADNYIYLVTGCDKSTTWGIATFSEGSSSNTAAVSLTATQMVNTSVSHTHSWSTHSSGFDKIGPDLVTGVSLPQSQCLFLRGMRIKVRENAIGRLVNRKGTVKVKNIKNVDASKVFSSKANRPSSSAYTPQPPPKDPFGLSSLTRPSSSSLSNEHQDFEDISDSSDENEVDFRNEIYGPHNVILEYLLEKTKARVVIARESDWWPLFQGNIIPNKEEVVERLSRHFNILEKDHGAYLCPIEIFPLPHNDQTEIEHSIGADASLSANNGGPDLSQDVHWLVNSYQGLSIHSMQESNSEYRLPMPDDPRPPVSVNTPIDTRSPNSLAHAPLPSLAGSESPSSGYPRIERQSPYTNLRSLSAEIGRDLSGHNSLYPDKWETEAVSGPERGPMGSASPSSICGQHPIVRGQTRANSSQTTGSASESDELSPTTISSLTTPGDLSAGRKSESDSDESLPSMISSMTIVAAGHSAPAPSFAKRTTNPRRNKMHTCSFCQKQFPRPSGLKTHMNSHMRDKPFECPAMGCDKRFTVLSNAKRHLKTHSTEANTTSAMPERPAFEVDFKPPVVARHHQSHDAGVIPQPPLKWVQPGPTVHQGDGWEASGSGAPSQFAPVAGPSSRTYSQGPFSKTDDHDDI